MSVSAPYLEPIVTAAAVGREFGELRRRNLLNRIFEQLVAMARLHAANRYDRLTRDVGALRGRPATSIREVVAKRPDLFAANSPSMKASSTR
jgi:hypothetical protein